ncbi:hypothetical protein PCE1_005011 [Barthelona sp. PCE]
MGFKLLQVVRCGIGEVSDARFLNSNELVAVTHTGECFIVDLSQNQVIRHKNFGVPLSGVSCTDDYIVITSQTGFLSVYMTDFTTVFSYQYSFSAMKAVEARVVGDRLHLLGPTETGEQCMYLIFNIVSNTKEADYILSYPQDVTDENPYGFVVGWNLQPLATLHEGGQLLIYNQPHNRPVASFNFEGVCTCLSYVPKFSAFAIGFVSGFVTLFNDHPLISVRAAPLPTKETHESLGFSGVNNVRNIGSTLFVSIWDGSCLMIKRGRVYDRFLPKELTAYYGEDARRHSGIIDIDVSTKRLLFARTEGKIYILSC